MPGLTPNQDYPYPLDSDLQDVAGDIEKLAEAVDTDVFDVLTAVADKVSRAGDTMTGMLTLPGTTPTSLNHAARKGYVDTQDELRVAVTGDAMTGELNMGGNKITGLAAPTGTTDAVRKSYLDDSIVNAVRVDVTSTQIMAGALRSPRFTLTDLTPDNPDEVTSKQYVDEVMNTIFIANLNGDTATNGLLVQGSVGMVTLDGFAGAHFTFPNTFLFAPVMLASAANSSQSIFVGVNAADVTAGQGSIYGKVISTGAAAPGASVVFNWLAIGLAAGG